MTLTVRLDPTLESALERYCTDRGVTKSLVVQESLAVYLVSVDPSAAPSAEGPARGGAASASKSFRALAEAGLVGGVALGQGADKAAVRAKAAERLVRSKARRGGV